MRAVVYDRYGPAEVLHLGEVERPVPAADELLVRVRATAVTRADAETRAANRRSGLFTSVLSRLISGVRRPRQGILGSEFAGVVEAVGPGVTEFAVGDRVFGDTGFRFGSYAQFLSVRQGSRIASMPAGMTFEDAAAICDGGLNSLWCLRQGSLQKGESVLIYGASGAIGTAGVQLAKYFEAQVTGVTTTKNVGLVASLGADRVIDYTKQDFTKSGETYDVIFDAVGKHSFERSKGSLKPEGRYLATDKLENVVLALWTRRFSHKKVIFTLPPRYTKQDVLLLKQLIETGRFRAVVDRVYPWEQVVEATKYVETEQKVGNVILTVS